MPNDPRSTTQAEADLIASIVANIVEPGVIAPMEEIGWQHGQPPPMKIAAAETTPKAAPTAVPAAKPLETEPRTVTTTVAKPAEITVVATTPNMEIDWESLREANGKISGKYNTPAEAIKGMRHLVAMTREVRAHDELVTKERDEARAALAARPVVQPVVQPVVETKPVAPVSATALESVFDKIIEEGGTLDANTVKDLKVALEAHAREVAKATIELTLSERDKATAEQNAKWNKVDQYMRTNYPESVDFTDEMSLFVQTSPTVGPVVRALIAAGNELEASAYAWTQYDQARKADIATVTKTADEKREIVLDAAAQVRQEAVDQARKDAGVVTTMAQGVHEAPTAGSTQEEIDAAAAEMRATGLGENWRRLAFGHILKDPVFDNFS